MVVDPLIKLRLDALGSQDIKLIRVETFIQKETSLCKVTFSNGAIGFGQLGNKDVDLSTELLHRRVVPALQGMTLVENALGMVDQVSRWRKDGGRLDLMSPLMLRVLQFEFNYKTMGVQLSNAVAGVDSAVWDAIGRQLNMPLREIWHRLFFFQTENDVPSVSNIPVYASSIAREVTAVRLADEFSRLYRSYGIMRFKMKIGERMRGISLQPFEVESIQLSVQTVHDALMKQSSAMKLAYDANGAFGCWEDVQKIFAGLPNVRPWFVEEPLPWFRSAIERPTGDDTSILLAGGEQEFRSDIWQAVLANRTFDVMQPDFGYSGGPSSVLLIAIASLSRSIQIAPHCPQNDLHPFMAYHLLGALGNNQPNIGIELGCVNDGVLLVVLDREGRFTPKFALNGGLRIQKGHAFIERIVSGGWGLEINEEWLAKSERRVLEIGSTLSGRDPKRSFL